MLEPSHNVTLNLICVSGHLQETQCVAYGRAGIIEIRVILHIVFLCLGPIPTLPGAAKAVCPLQGLLTSELVCLACQHTVSLHSAHSFIYFFCTLSQRPVTYEVFHSLSLNLPLGQTEVESHLVCVNLAHSFLSQCSLHSCLLDFIKSEAVADVECGPCSKVRRLSWGFLFLLAQYIVFRVKGEKEIHEKVVSGTTSSHPLPPFEENCLAPFWQPPQVLCGCGFPIAP